MNIEGSDTWNTMNLLKATEVAQILNISRSLAYRLMQKGDIPTVRINRSVRVLSDDLHDYIMEHKNNRNSAAY